VGTRSPHARSRRPATHPCDPALESNRESTVRRHAVAESFDVALVRDEVFAAECVEVVLIPVDALSARPELLEATGLVGSFGHLGQGHADLAKSLG
jgi:hypothetical protein